LRQALLCAPPPPDQRVTPRPVCTSTAPLGSTLSFRQLTDVQPNIVRRRWLVPQPFCQVVEHLF
jgi:hypothetical protein